MKRTSMMREAKIGKVRVISVEMPIDLYKRLEARARSKMLAVSAEVRTILAEALGA